MPREWTNASGRNPERGIGVPQSWIRPNEAPLPRVCLRYSLSSMNRPAFPTALRLAAFGLFAFTFTNFAAPFYQQDFNKAEVGSLPEDLMPLDGQFAVREEAGNRFLELPGAPLESFGFLFGGSTQGGTEVSARIFSTKQGRKFPTFAIGLNGASGYRLQVSPAKKSLEILKGDTVAASVPFDWKSGEWTEMRLRIGGNASGSFRVEGRAWASGSPEPAQPLVTLNESTLLPGGKSGAWGMPFAGTPIRFDDLRVTKTP